MSEATVIGTLAAFCTTIAYVPQVAKAWRTRSTEDISIHMYLLMVTGVVLWAVYGIILRDPVLIAANVVTACLAGSVLYLKLHAGGGPPDRGER